MHKCISIFLLDSQNKKISSDDDEIYMINMDTDYRLCIVNHHTYLHADITITIDNESPIRFNINNRDNKIIPILTTNRLINIKAHMIKKIWFLDELNDRYLNCGIPNKIFTKVSNNLQNKIINIKTIITYLPRSML